MALSPRGFIDCVSVGLEVLLFVTLQLSYSFHSVFIRMSSEHFVMIGVIVLVF